MDFSLCRSLMLLWFGYIGLQVRHLWLVRRSVRDGRESQMVISVVAARAVKVAEEKACTLMVTAWDLVKR